MERRKMGKSQKQKVMNNKRSAQKLKTDSERREQTTNPHTRILSLNSFTYEYTLNN